MAGNPAPRRAPDEAGRRRGRANSISVLDVDGNGLGPAGGCAAIVGDHDVEIRGMPGPSTVDEKYAPRLDIGLGKIGYCRALIVQQRDVAVDQI